ncbi:hypothetical protein [Saccharothrix variisporea]|uniref:Uncharacterized protein n=1 Tax=Saccharothrix variisporea TaxID=543527 RepID=A0A495X0C1_9PSEU|nr:hypothetical protein [Saccharothrix variisporea]RKT67109.1 hypothetical protein DFJ66_0277 [Saccharothrix variisporea]
MATLDVLTLTEAKQGLNEVNATGLDAELPAWITAVSLRLDQLVGPIVRRSVSESLDGGRCTVHLHHYPVYSITTVTEYNHTTPTVLTAETNLSKPASAYLAEPYDVPVSLADGSQLVLLSGAIRRRASGSDTWFPTGRRNVVIAYSAGRFADTASVDQRYKRAAVLCLQNIWQSQRISTAIEGEFDVPVSNFPRFVIPNAVKEMFPGEVQAEPNRFLVA